MADWKRKTALIISGAPETNLRYINEVIERLNQPLIVCADRGLDYAVQLGLQPDLYVGDSDSCTSIPQNCECIKLIPEKDDTDTMHALNILIERGCKKSVIVCATGGRIDHMLANLSLCEYAAEHDHFCSIVDSENVVSYFTEGNLVIENDLKYRYFSIIPLDNELLEVTITGAKYPLDRRTVSRSNILTISNEFAGNSVCISVKKGRWLLVRSVG